MRPEAWHEGCTSLGTLARLHPDRFPLPFAVSCLSSSKVARGHTQEADSLSFTFKDGRIRAYFWSTVIPFMWHFESLRLGLVTVKMKDLPSQWLYPVTQPSLPDWQKGPKGTPEHPSGILGTQNRMKSPPLCRDPARRSWAVFSVFCFISSPLCDQVCLLLFVQDRGTSRRLFSTLPCLTMKKGANTSFGGSDVKEKR